VARGSISTPQTGTSTRRYYKVLLHCPIEWVARVCPCVGWILGQRDHTLGQQCGLVDWALRLICSSLQASQLTAHRSRQKQCSLLSTWRSMLLCFVTIVSAFATADCDAGDGRFLSALSPRQISRRNTRLEMYTLYSLCISPKRVCKTHLIHSRR
jgi:hypothetical protein